MLDNFVLEFVRGRLTFEEFGSYLHDNPHIWMDIQALLTEEMKNDPNCSFWNRTNYQIHLANNFDVKAAALAFGYHSEYGKSRLHMVISDLVEYTYPTIVRRFPISCTPTDILEQVGMSYVEGDETEPLLRQLVCDIPDTLTKKEKAHLLKESIRKSFHLVPRKVPKWVQEPEWPMGEHMPMEFVQQHREGDLVKFTFRDVETGELRVIEQFY